MDQGKRVWAPDFKEGFVLGEISDFATDTITVQPVSGAEPIEAQYEAVYPAEEDGAPYQDDNCGLMFLNEGTMLNNIKRRYMEDEIYTYTANILIALNPYQRLPMYTKEIMKKYVGTSLGVEPPHVYAVSDKAYRDMRNLGLDQGMLVSGESGAGKTESTKYMLQYICIMYGGGGVEGLEERILAANPFLESYGNAKTSRNNNSSRFGKFVELHFNKQYKVVGCFISHYLLEKSRINEQNDAERNYHSFYRICATPTEAIRSALKLDPDYKKWEFLSKGDCGEVPGLDDAKDFAEMEAAMTECKLTSEDKSNVFRVTAAVLHLGNVKIAADSDGNAGITDAGSKETIKGISTMLGVDADKMSEAIVKKSMTIAGNKTFKALTLRDAEFNRDALAKSMYSKLFDEIVGMVNKSFPSPSSQNYIGILDIAGFEYFQVNTFEQFCINFCNERLQKFFNQRVLKDEQELYIKESITFREVEFVDNQDTIDLINHDKTGILALLDDVTAQPSSNDNMFAEKLHSVHKKHFRLQEPRKSKMSYYKKMRANEGFIVRHFAGAVCYQAEGFMDKNDDALMPDLVELLANSKDDFTKGIFKELIKIAEKNKGKMKLISLGKKFKVALKELMDKLESTRSTFVRCIKPNQAKKPKVFQGGEILSQLQCAGMVSVLDLMQGGFPSRTAFKDLYDMYAPILPDELKSLDPRTFAQALFKALGLNEDDFQFGVSKVFFRPGKFAEFDTIMKGDPETIQKLVGKVLDFLKLQRWKKLSWAVVSCLKFANKIRARAGAIILMQSVVRMFLAQQPNLARMKAIKRVSALNSKVPALVEASSALKKEKEKIDGEINKMKDAISSGKKEIKTSPSIENSRIEAIEAEIEKLSASIMKKITKAVQKEKLAAEAERLKKIAEEMEKERKRKEAEEAAAAQRAADLEAEKKADLENKRADEAAELQAEKDRIAAEKAAGDKKAIAAVSAAEKQAAEEEAMLEQERRDQELAMRLAMDAGEDGADGALSDEARKVAKAGKAAGRRRSVNRQKGTQFMSKKQAALHKKHDLSKWKYADLRDTINTSVNVELLEACREEFHRRLKVYHAWKMKNQNKKKGSSARAPKALHDAAAKRGAAPPPKKKKKNTRPQRFFRIPFVRPGDKGSANAKKGWWFAHFDGQWIARQMELHPEKAPVLLVAGKDDMEMCELSLDETGLARKRGAEVLAREFEDEWAKCGGKPYAAKTGGKK